MPRASEPSSLHVWTASVLSIMTAVYFAGALPALADKPFSGEDAAYIDWAWKNCEYSSTDKQHQLVDEARNKSNDAFQRSYEQEYTKIVAANPGRDDVRRTCEKIKDWYGKDGNRIARLILPKTDKPYVEGERVGKSTPLKGGGGRQ